MCLESGETTCPCQWQSDGLHCSAHDVNDLPLNDCRYHLSGRGEIRFSWGMDVSATPALPLGLTIVDSSYMVRICRRRQLSHYVTFLRFAAAAEASTHSHSYHVSLLRCDSREHSQQSEPPFASGRNCHAVPVYECVTRLLLTTGCAVRVVITVQSTIRTAACHRGQPCRYCKSADHAARVGSQLAQSALPDMRGQTYRRIAACL